MIPGVTVQAPGRPRRLTVAIHSSRFQSLALGKAKPQIALVHSPLSMSAAARRLYGKTLSVATSASISGTRNRTRIMLAPIGAAVSAARNIAKVFSPQLGQSLLSPAPFSAAVSQFIARTSGLDTTHQNAYIGLIDGLVADAVWTKLDVLYVFATQNSTMALLNVKSSSFGGVSHGSPSFTTDRGFTGVDASGTVYIDTQFNPTSGSPQFAANSCHASAWGVTNLASSSSGGCIIGSEGLTSGNRSNIFPRFSDGNAYFRINDSGSSAGFASASSVGHWLESRTGASASVGYKNAVVVGSPNAASGTLQSKNFFVLACNTVGSVAGTGSGVQLAMASLGAGLSSTDVTNFYNRLRTYMTAVGVP